jgi:AmpD protein
MLKVAVSTGLVSFARQVDSLNCDDRRPAADPTVVIHGSACRREATVGVDRPAVHEYAAARQDPYFATIQHLRFSHVLIERDGNLTQYVPFHERACTPAVRTARRDECNDFSVGIELEGTDEEPYDDRQYETLAKLILALQQTYPMLADGWIAGHSDIAPGRKTDPGPAFDWRRLERDLRASGARFRREVLA